MAASCVGWLGPLNLECILVNTFAGSMELFTLLMVIFIAGVGAYFRMVNVTVLLMFALFAVIMAQYMQGIYFLVVVVAGLLVSFGINRVIKQ